MSETESRSRRRRVTASASLNAIIGPMVIVLGLMMGLIYWQQVHVESKLIEQNREIIECQDRWNDAFAETIKVRFYLSTKRKDSIAKLMLGVGKVIDDVVQSGKRGVGVEQEYAAYHRLFSRFAREEEYLAKLRAENPLPDYPECFDVKAAPTPSATR